MNANISLEEYKEEINKILAEKNCSEEQIMFITHFCKSKIQKYWETGIEPELAVNSLMSS